MDFCNDHNSWLIDFKFVTSKSHFNLDFSYWAEPSFVHLGELIRHVYTLSEEEVRKKTKEAMKVVGKMTWNTVALKNKNFIASFTSICAIFSVFIALSLSPIFTSTIVLKSAT